MLDSGELATLVGSEKPGEMPEPAESKLMPGGSQTSPPLQIENLS